MANFQLSPEALAAQAAAKAEQDKIKQDQADREKYNGFGQGVATIPEIMKNDQLTQASINAESDDQARRGGVETATANAPAGGIAGFFGGQTTTQHFTAGNSTDPTIDKNKAALAYQVAEARSRKDKQMGAAQAGQAAQLGQAATIASGPQDQFRAQQVGLANQLGTAAAGAGGPSAANAQLKMATDRNMAQSLALALGARGGNQGAAMKQAQMQRALISQEAGGQSAALRAQEQQAAQGQLGQVLGSARGADIGLATDQAGLQQQGIMQQGQFDQQKAMQQGDFNQQAATTNLAASIQQQEQRDKMIQSYLAQGMSLDQAAQQAKIQQAQFNAELLARQAAADKGVAMQSSQAAGQTAGQAATAIAGAIATAASDERVKTDIEPGADDLAEFFDAIGAHKYKYKDPDRPLRGHGVFVSPMAQELELTELGRHMVSTAPDGTKIVDYGKGFGLLLAALKDQHERIRKIEGVA